MTSFPLITALACFFAAHAGSPTVLFYKDAQQALDETYWPKFSKLFIHEGADNYPMPGSDKVVDLLPGLKDVKGISVFTEPGTTVTEGQGYALLAAGMRKDLDSLKGLTVAWQANGQGFEDTPACGGCGVNEDVHFDPKQICTGEQPTKCLCKTVPGAYMPGWDMPYLELGSMGSATDGDTDALTGLVYLAALTDSREFQEYAVKSIAAFVLEDLGFADPEKNSRRVPSGGDIPEALQTMWLWRGGTCWGGYDTSSPQGAENRNLCINPAYFSPGQWRLFRKFLLAHADLVPEGHKAEELAAVLDSAIVWGYNTLKRIACPSGLVSNWWTVPDQGWPWNGELKCTNSGTQAGAYYSDAARIPWRVVLDYVWFGDEARTTVYDDDGKEQGTWGAKEYANRWSAAWKAAIKGAGESGTYPPLSEGAIPLRKDQILPLLSDIEKCDTCPMGFTASPWNGWGGFPVLTTFQVPADDTDEGEMQSWLDFVSERGIDGCEHDQYFDLGQEIIVSQMLSGAAWLPLSDSPEAEEPAPTRKPSTTAREELTTTQKEQVTTPEDAATTPVPAPKPKPKPSGHVEEEHSGVSPAGGAEPQGDDDQDDDGQEDDDQEDDDQEDYGEEDDGQEDDSQEDDDQEEDVQEEDSQEDDDQEDDNQEADSQQDDDKEDDEDEDEQEDDDQEDGAQLDPSSTLHEAAHEKASSSDAAANVKAAISSLIGRSTVIGDVARGRDNDSPSSATLAVVGAALATVGAGVLVAFGRGNSRSSASAARAGMSLPLGMVAPASQTGVE